MNYEQFPKSKTLRQGTVLASIVHAVMAPRYFELFHEYSWDGTNHGVQNSMGGYGTIAFLGSLKGDLVAVFFDAHSSRNPFPLNVHYEVGPFFTNMPPHLFSLAYEQALQYRLEEYNGKIQPVITSAFWCVEERLAAAEPWSEVFENGAHLLEDYFMPAESALAEYREGYEMTKDEFKLSQSLFARKIANPSKIITITPSEKAILLEQAEPGGIENSRIAFKPMGIFLP